MSSFFLLLITNLNLYYCAVQIVFPFHRKKDAKKKKHVTIQSLLLVLSFRYKSNEDYVYVRGRGRGKYICEECGIRCKKPSMLKKHIRTHTDVRPYVCKFCNFAFKTKGRACCVCWWIWMQSPLDRYSVCHGTKTTNVSQPYDKCAPHPGRTKTNLIITEQQNFL